MEINKYRKPDQYYEDKYDLETISELKRFEKESKIPLKFPEQEFGGVLVLTERWDPRTPFYEHAVMRAKIRRSVIEAWMSTDSQCDYLIKYHRPPSNVKCNKCGSLMSFCTHIFSDKNEKVIFVYDCPKNHLPKKAIYSDGREYHVPKSRCTHCGGELKRATSKTKKFINIKETCEDCGKVFSDKMELPNHFEKRISEEDRKKYCEEFIGKTTLLEDIKQLANLYESLEESKTEKEIEIDNGVDKIEIVKVADMEERLSEAVEEGNFTKFKFETPKMRPFFHVEFSAHDRSDRNEHDSKRILVGKINKSIFPTNWRLMTTEIQFRLGFFTGKLRAYEDKEGLIKIGREIKAKQAKKSK